MKLLPKLASTLSTESLRWVLGLYCAFVGAFVLVAPHRFAGPLYIGLAPYRTGWGVMALAGGVSLLAVAILRYRQGTILLGHLLAGATFLTLAATFGQSRAWTGVIAYSVLGLGVLFAGLLPRRPPLQEGSAEPGGHPGRHDLFGLAMGVIAVLDGLLFLTGTAWAFQTAYFDPMRPYLLKMGAAMLLGGGLLMWVQLRREPSWRVSWAAHLAAGAAFGALGTLLSLPGRAWSGLALYWGCGLALAFLPRLSRRLSRLDPSALRTRLAFSLATATSIALILTAAVATHQEERLALEQVQASQEAEARSIARNIADYVQLNGARTAVVATLAGGMPMDPFYHRALLEASRPSYPDVKGFITLDAAGTVLAATGGVPLDLSDWRAMVADLRDRGRNGGISIILAGDPRRPLLLLGAPIVAEERRLAGALVAAFDSNLLVRRISRPGSNVYLADGHGRLIVDEERSAVDLPALPAGWDREFLLGRESIPARRIAEFARVPGGLDWVVAVEKPRDASLAGVRQGRDLAFMLLLLVVPLAVAGGIFAARRIARPLGTLAGAVDELTAGNPAAPLESSDITEVERLAAAFREMRDRLAERTRESERLAMELRARAETLAESDRRKDEFLAMLAHELRNPLGAIANASYVLEQIGSAEAPMQRAVAVIQRQIQHLVRLVDDLLDISRITRGKIELRRQPVDLREAVRGAVEMTRPMVESKEHALRVHLPSEPLPLHADVTRLEQALGNLVRNAAKYTESGGRIEVSADRRDGEAVVVIRDNGIGIGPDLLPRIFDLFIQGEQSLDRSGGGLGIGLTLVRRLVEMHGGRVEARSDGEGKGSEFSVHLPLSVS